LVFCLPTVISRGDILLSNIAKVFLKAGRDEAPSRGNPWVYSGSIARVEGEVESGDIVDLFSQQGEFLGRGYCNPRSQIVVRVLAKRPVAIDHAFFQERINRAFSLRKTFLPRNTTVYRIINSEGDLLPGLIVDKYGDYLTIQLLTAGMEKVRGDIIGILQDMFSPQGIYDRSDPGARAEEGMPDSTGPIMGVSFPDRIEILENGVRFLVDVKRGQKTGFYLDQRDNRSLIMGLTQGKKVLNCFSYTGGFAVYASLGGAVEVTSVEASEGALEMFKENLTLNGIPLERHRLVKGDVFQFLRKDRGEYDIIILDPPAFAKRKGMVQGAIRGYKDINLYAMVRAKRGGLILSCSCSQHIDKGLFQKILSYAATDARKQIQIVGQWGAPRDHPVSLQHPEGEYLKSFLLRIVE
jgi:23S rRNA (cytosine1962-C5)-methyltransferase